VNLPRRLEEGFKVFGGVTDSLGLDYEIKSLTFPLAISRRIGGGALSTLAVNLPRP